MKTIGFVCILFSMVALSGCAKPIDPLTYAAKQEILIGSQSAYTESIRVCVTFLSGNSREARRLIELSKASPQVTCERFISARRAGRVTYEIYVNRVAGREPAEFVQILQGR